MSKFNVLDDLSFASRMCILILCGVSCCWGFANNSILLVFAGKIGFPIGVAAAAMTVNRQQIYNVLCYSMTLITLGCLFFYVYPVEINPSMTNLYVPTAVDFLLALGLGAALGHLWNHVTRINIVVMIAGLASLLPACIMAGYFLSRAEFDLMLDSMALYAQYVIGIAIGAWIYNYIEKRHDHS